MCADSFQRLSSPAPRWRHSSDIAQAGPLGPCRRGLRLGVITAAVVLTSNHTDLRGAVAVLGLTVGWGFIGAGLFAWARRPDNSLGSLMALTGFAFLMAGLSSSNIPAVFTVGALLSSVYIVTTMHTLLAAPHGTLSPATAAS